jgi:hypothetical protein
MNAQDDISSGLLVLLRALSQVEPARLPAPDAAPVAGALWLSPVEQEVIGKLDGGVWLTADQLAEKIGEPVNSRLRVILANLVERKLLTSDTRRGYSLR